MDDSCRGSDVTVREGGDILLEKVHQSAVRLQKGEQREGAVRTILHASPTIWCR